MKTFFTADADPSAKVNQQLFATDGTAGSGTVLLTSGGSSFGSFPDQVKPSGGLTYFTTSTSTFAQVIWSTDGTTVTKLLTTPAGSFIGSLTPFITAGGTAALAFTAVSETDPSATAKVYVTDGTAAGTKAASAGFTTAPPYFVVSGSTVYFVAAGGSEVWATDGSTSTKLEPVVGAATDTYSSPGFLTPFTLAGGQAALAFVGVVKGGYQVFVTTGTAGSGTVAVSSVFKSVPYSLTVSGNQVLFLAVDGLGGTGVWAIDGKGTTVTHLDAGTGSADSYGQAIGLTPFVLASGASATAFIANSGSVATPKWQVYVTDGTVAGTKPTGASFTIPPGAPLVAGGKVFFTGTDATGTELYATDGGNAVQLEPVTTATKDSYISVSGLISLTVPGGSPSVAFFGNTGTVPQPHYQLFISDGTVAGTKAVGTSFNTLPYYGSAAGGRLAFIALDTLGGREVWIADTSGLTKLEPVANGSSDSYTNAGWLTPFTTPDFQQGYAFVGQVGGQYTLYVSDGTAAGTKAVVTGAISISGLYAVGTKLYFDLVNAAGEEIWVMDGKTATKLDPVLNASSNSYESPYLSTPVVYGLDVLDASKAEGDSGTTVMRFMVARGGDLMTATTLTYAVAGSGTAPAGAADFGGGAFPKGSISFAPGESAKLVSIAVAGDTAVEPDETYKVTLSAGTGVVATAIVAPTASATILNDDSAYAIAGLDATKPEGNAGSTAFTFTVTRSGLTTGVGSVNYAVTGSGASPAVAADFVGGALPAGTVSFAAGETSKTITVNVAGDTVVEPDEGFTVTLSGAPNITTATAAATIVNDDTAYAIAALDATKPEGNAGSTPFTFTVTRSGLVTGVGSVAYAVTGSGASPAVAADFVGGALPAGTVSFATGETSKTITVNVAGDTVVEPDGGFTVTLSGAAGITTATATGTITNDDTTPPAKQVGVVNGKTGAASLVDMTMPGAGSPSYLQWQYIYDGTDNMAMSTQTPNVFLHSGSGDDAIQVTSGQNVLDGGLGSNFLTGGTGAGSDTFFTDARNPGVVWNTIRNFHQDDAATLWGFVDKVSSYYWEKDLKGAPGSEGATLRANIVGGNGRIGDGIDASITFTGLSVDQAKSLNFATGTQPAGSYLYIYNPGV